MNTNLALSDEILMQIKKPERYIGNEVNAVMKDPRTTKIRFAMCFPDVYDIGMSHLGIQILYGMMNEWDDVWCERVYSPWPDLDAILRQRQIPLFALESQEPVSRFDFLGFTLQYELCYTNVLQVLDLSGIPILADERDWDDPIVIGGGPCTYNPEPIADFFDLFYIGEGETRYRQLFDVYLDAKREGVSRNEFLRRCAQIPGIYVPSLYRVDYHDDGIVARITPLDSEIPPVIEKEMVQDLSSAYYPEKPVVPYIQTAQDRVVLEILRGCIRGCRFCQAGQLYRPFRERDLEVLKQQAIALLKNTGHEEISLSSLSSSDYSRLQELVNFLIGYCSEKQINISLPSLRIDAFSLDIMSKIQDVKKSSLTFAPEAGTQRLRDVINKGISKEDILRGAHDAFLGGWNKVKLYFMLGIPFETDADIQGIGDIANAVCAEYFDTVPKEKRNGRTVEVTASTSFFIPKPFTPFQWAPMNTRDEFLDKAAKTRRGITSQLNQKHIKYNWHEADASVLEGIFARGDRKLSAVIQSAYQKGCMFDAWGEFFHYDHWLESFASCQIDMDFYVSRMRGEQEIFPWEHLSCGVSKAFLYREWKRAKEGQVTPNCRVACSGCCSKNYSRFGTVCPGNSVG